jgi:hypothetical protein
MKIKFLKKAVLPICLSVCIAGSAMAADAKSPDDEWHFTLAPLKCISPVTQSLDGTSLSY